jgi:hypothetical protein
MQVSKNTFVVFYSGERAKAKILKICDAFRANRYPFPEDLAKQMHTIAEVSTWKYVICHYSMLKFLFINICMFLLLLK